MPRAARINAGAKMRQAGSIALFEYWNALRRDRAAPERTELDPVAMRNFLAETFMLEVDQIQSYRFCLSGTKLNALFNTELKGCSFLPLWNPAQRQDILSLLQAVTDETCPIIAGALTAPEGYDQIELELLLLPLRHHGKTHSRVLGRIAAAKQPGWLGLIPVKSLDLTSMRVLDTNPAAASVSMNQTAFVPNGAAPAYERRRHLRVYTVRP